MLDLSGFKLTFDDEFNQRSISQNGQGTTWSDIRAEWRGDANADVGFGRSSFMDAASGYDPFNVAGGALSITAVPDRTPFGVPGSWESGLIHTKGEFAQTYGYFEMRADLADNPGGWDAFWLLPVTPANNLPGGQELDVIEHYGVYNVGSYRWIHTTDYNPNPNDTLQVFSNDPTQVSGYHTYGMDWQADKISFYFDGHLVGSRATPSDMHGPMYLLADLATQQDADSAGVPITSKIDYIRACSNSPGAVGIPLETISSPDGVDTSDLHGAQSLSNTPVTPVATSAHSVYRFYDTVTHDHFYTTDPTEKANIQAHLPAFRYEGSTWATPDKGADTLDVFRFLDTATGTHHFTMSPQERDQIAATLPNFHYEGVAFQAYKGGGADEITLERFYNADSHVHHFASSAQEAADIRAGLAGHGWVDEGAGFTIHAPIPDFFI